MTVPPTDGWAVLEKNDWINVRTVSPTRRAAIVNWLCTKGILATQLATDEQIEKQWALDSADFGVRVAEVEIAVTTPTEWTFNRPKHGWVCFFCGETFRTPGAAEHHFGATLASRPACCIKGEGEFGLVTALRAAEANIAKLEQEIDRYREDDGPKDREMAAQESRHKEALRTAEEQGYARGLADMRKDGWRLNEERERPDLYPAQGATS